MWSTTIEIIYFNAGAKSNLSSQNTKSINTTITTTNKYKSSSFGEQLIACWFFVILIHWFLPFDFTAQGHTWLEHCSLSCIQMLPAQQTQPWEWIIIVDLLKCVHITLVTTCSHLRVEKRSSGDSPLSVTSCQALVMNRRLVLVTCLLCLNNAASLICVSTEESRTKDPKDATGVGSFPTNFTPEAREDSTTIQPDWLNVTKTNNGSTESLSSSTVDSIGEDSSGDVLTDDSKATNKSTTAELKNSSATESGKGVGTKPTRLPTTTESTTFDYYDPANVCFNSSEAWKNDFLRRVVTVQYNVRYQIASFLGPVTANRRQLLRRSLHHLMMLERAVDRVPVELEQESEAVSILLKAERSLNRIGWSVYRQRNAWNFADCCFKGTTMKETIETLCGQREKFDILTRMMFWVWSAKKCFRPVPVILFFPVGASNSSQLCVIDACFTKCFVLL